MSRIAVREVGKISLRRRSARFIGGQIIISFRQRRGARVKDENEGEARAACDEQDKGEPVARTACASPLLKK